MSEREELRRRLDAYDEALSEKVGELRATAESYNSYIQLLARQKEILELYGAQMPVVMQVTELIIQEIAAASGIEIGVSVENPPAQGTPRLPTVSVGERIETLRPRARRRITPDTSIKEGLRKGESYTIAPVVKPIMNAMFGSGEEGVPTNLDNLFERMYGQDWPAKKLLIPAGPGKMHQETTYGDDLLSDNSYLKRLVRGADEVINTKMRKNSAHAFEVGGKAAAPELVQLFNVIDSIGWDVYDDFMIRNGIRDTEIPR